MAEGFPIQQTGVTASAVEFRRALAGLISEEGILRGLGVTVGSNQVTVAAGIGAIQDSQTVPAFYTAPLNAAVVVPVPAQASGTRQDTLYMAVNDSAAPLGVTGLATGMTNPVPVGDAYVALAQNSGAIPATAMALGTLAVTGSSIVFTPNNTLVVFPPLAGRFVRADVAAALHAGSTVPAPGAPLEVANRAYVDGLAARSPYFIQFWGNRASYGPWAVPDGTWNTPPGALFSLNLVAGHLYEIHSEFTLAPPVDSLGYLARGSIQVNGAVWMQDFYKLRDPNAFPTSMSVKLKAGYTGAYEIKTAFGANGFSKIVVVNSFDSPFTEVTDLGPGHF